MGYFSNGTEGCSYESKYCENCIHWVFDEREETKGCPVWDLHMDYNYGQDAKTGEILDVLIPRNEVGVSNEQCTMFIQVKSEGQTNF